MVQNIIENVEKVIVGKRQVIEYFLTCILSNGHILFEDIPGVGKTMLSRAMAISLGMSFKRIQCTPDLLPSDITGVSIFNQKIQEFEFKQGPVFANLILADEINRATPRTQSSLLECMEERQVTVEGVSIKLPRPFIVMATQNPIEYEGVFPLPEAQLDRFLMKLSIGYPSYEDEMEIIRLQKIRHPIEDLKPVSSLDEVISIQEKIKEVYVDETVIQYILDIVSATRKHSDIAVGASPRGSLALFRTSQALAYIRGRDYVLPDDIKELAPLVLSHRIILKSESYLRGYTQRGVISSMLTSIEVPVGKVK
ncbi:MAG TPA: MoxR family ATPase [bacterium]|jgi:MoxR-like ATPase|nr:MoxR family ATPase [Dictyoglomota bacterium]HHV81688.1 MoxR family ATPase [bacterium]HOP56328.1 MoxR family ATPase [bacterium]